MADINVTASELATARVRVYGKAMNRTVLGIVNAYLLQYPHATLEDLKKAFPNTLATASGKKDMFILKEETSNGGSFNDYFVAEDEIISLADGNDIAVYQLWTKDNFPQFVQWAKQYLVIVAEFEKSMKGEKGGFRLEYLNGWTPEAPAKKKMPAWIWAVIALAAIAIAAAAFLLGNSGKQTEVVEKIVEVHDTLYVQQLEEIEKNFNAAEFELGKADLSEEARFVLHDLGKLMQQNPDLHLRIAGHTSAEGDADANQKLSEDRAQAAVTFLAEHEGVEVSRLEAKGYGSSKLKNAENPNAEENRRTEFEVIK